MIDAYFAECDQAKEPYTVSGLALALDCTRKTLLNYEAREEFLPTIEKAKAKCEAYAEKRLFGTAQVAGAIFNLTNNYEGWSNKHEMNLGGQNGKNPLDASLTISFVKPKSDA